MTANAFWYRRQAPLVQRLLSAPLASFFLQSIPLPNASDLYYISLCSTEAVTDELVDILAWLRRAIRALAVFVAFTAYSSGPTGDP